MAQVLECLPTKHKSLNSEILYCPSNPQGKDPLLQISAHKKAWFAMFRTVQLAVCAVLYQILPPCLLSIKEDQ
jgi:hypothetical protein